MARRVGASQTLIFKLIHRNLKQRKRKKVKVHHLIDRMIALREQRALKSYELIKDRKYEYILTMNEAMLPLDGLNGQREFFYKPKDREERSDDPPVLSGSPSHPQQRMFAAGFSWRGQTRLYVVPKEAKVNADLFIEHILRPMMLEDVSRLFGLDADKVVLHMDSAPAHTAKKVYQWLRDKKIKFITKEEWLSNSPDLSPMDFFANGYLKSQLKQRRFRSMDGMLKAAGEEWSKISLEKFRNALESWPARVLAVHKAHGRPALNY